MFVVRKARNEKHWKKKFFSRSNSNEWRLAHGRSWLG